MSDLDPCGCCEPEIVEPSVANPAGQPALRYRAAPHAEALRRMVARLPRWTLPDGPSVGQRPLARLTTRAADDPALALLDGWAVVTDVLTFYQERIANEGFLRTATERRSVLELARAIGYELNPGVAASTFIAFTVDDSPGAPGTASIPAGTQVQSLPAAAGELPQTFETGEAFIAQVRWNALRPRRTEPQLVNLASVQTLYLTGTALGLKAGTVLLLVRPNVQGNARAYGIYTVRTAVAEPDNDRTAVTVAFQRQVGDGSPPPSQPTPPAPAASSPQPFTATNAEALVFSRELEEAKLLAILSSNGWEADALLRYANEERTVGGGEVQPYAMRERLSFFGHNAPRWDALPALQRFGGTVDDTDVAAIYPDSWDDPGNTIWTDAAGEDYEDQGEADAFLERALPDLLPDTWAVFAGRTRAGETRWEAFGVVAVSEESLADYAISGKTTGLTLRYAEGGEVRGILGKRARTRRRLQGLSRAATLQAAAPRSSEARQSIQAQGTEFAIATPAQSSGQVIATGGSDPRPGFLLRRTTVHLKSEALALAPLPITDPVPAAAITLTLDRMVIGLRAGQPVALVGEQSDAPGTAHTEILFLKRVTHSDGLTTLEFEAGLSYSYVRESVTLNANVVAASHGETVTSEVLGSGNGAQANQRFTLRKPPLTYVSAATSSGAASTLEIRVNRVAWQQGDSLYGQPPEGQRYIVRHDDVGNATVIFGDGKQGARLPTGAENVVARYRSGIGKAGEVTAGRITLLKTRPFGVRSASNPVPATGAADPEQLNEARGNAPLTVLTLERIVSLKDFENFARSFAGIGKASAVSLWSGERQKVHVTIADTDGDAVSAASDLYRNLQTAVAAARDPLRAVEIESFEPLGFNIRARLLRDPAHLWEDVKRAAEAALLAAFQFEARAFGQPVTSAEVIATLQATPGVVAVDLDALQRVDAAGNPVAPTLSAILPARPARWDPVTRDILPAQLLRINPAGVELVEMK